MSNSSVFKGIVRNICTTITIVGLCLLGLICLDASEGVLAARYFPNSIIVAEHQVYALLLAVPVPLHLIFIGLILQKRWLSEPLARCAVIGIIGSGVWLGVALGVKFFVL
ncbi:hypothetical protein GO013_02190 [Pseudodesulfovibrio sp. JC047]|uniref:hypothetical protein n=1 Tax=Pseudodesulfovibrio sp. JC047 TaxID=2683199 RepID=UPI0013CFB7F1|nr:hypothetical protein [Pseudodesulfovibrio sp. JC047]NDV18228.1 hypothetical protein [Pseudodesulfovibrio sp. JC047]